MYVVHFLLMTAVNVKEGRRQPRVPGFGHRIRRLGFSKAFKRYNVFDRNLYRKHFCDQTLRIRTYELQKVVQRGMARRVVRNFEQRLEDVIQHLLEIPHGALGSVIVKEKCQSCMGKQCWDLRNAILTCTHCTAAGFESATRRFLKTLGCSAPSCSECPTPPSAGRTPKCDTPPSGTCSRPGRESPLL